MGQGLSVSTCQPLVTHLPRVTFTFGVYQSTVHEVSQCGNQDASLLLGSSSGGTCTQPHEVQDPEPSFQHNQECTECRWGTKSQENMEPQPPLVHSLVPVSCRPPSLTGGEALAELTLVEKEGTEATRS